MIPFNKPFFTGNEIQYISDCVDNGSISGNGNYTKKCHDFFRLKFNLNNCLLTTSCTDALEMCAMLLDIKNGDEVIVPSFTFVSSALAFERQGAKIIFADSSDLNPNMDMTKVEGLITSKTKAVVVVHYAGISVDMDYLMNLSEKYGFYVIEDSAQAIDSYYKGNVLGSIGHLATFSFHETKNIIAGEAGLLVVNDKQFLNRAEVIWEKGTNRASFYRGEINKYGWVDTGSSFLPSEIVAAFLLAQLESLDRIQNKRKKIWDRYYKNLEPYSDKFGLPYINHYSTNNSHMFYLILRDIEERSSFISFLKKNDIHAVFHYQSLHKSDYILMKKYRNVQELPNSDRYTDCLVRLPLFFDLTDEEVDYICSIILKFFK